MGKRPAGTRAGRLGSDAAIAGVFLPTQFSLSSLIETFYRKVLICMPPVRDITDKVWCMQPIKISEGLFLVHPAASSG